MEIGFFELFEWITRAIEAAGVLVIVGGIVWASVDWLIRHLRHWTDKMEFRAYRARVGRSIILGLEFLVAADIVKTVTIDPTLHGLAVLGALVFIRTFLSFALEIEIEGRWPWRAAEQSGGEGPTPSL